jgi:endoglucanase Acf2
MRIKAMFVLTCFAICFLTPGSASAQVQVGKGSYVTSGNFAVPDHSPSITADFSQKVISSKWWVTLINKDFSFPMWAHPISYQTNSGGLDMGYPGASKGTGGGFSSAHVKDISVGIVGMAAPYTAVAAYSHFGVTARWSSGAMVMEATMAQGIPFAYFSITGGNAIIRCSGSPSIWYNQGGVLGITVAGRNYGIFGPTGSSWTGANDLVSTLAGKNYLSVALLPDNSEATLQFFRKYAYSFVKDTRVSWTYNEQTAILTTVFSVTTVVKEGAETGTIFAVFRHQWLSMTGPFLSYTYQSARGIMKTVSGPSFATFMKFNGILLSMPDTGFDMNTLKGLVQDENPPTIRGSTYNKDFGKFAQLVQIADMAGKYQETR